MTGPAERPQEEKKRMKVSVILNPNAGRNHVPPEELKRIFEENGCEPDMVRTKTREDGRRAVHEAVETGSSRIVCAGGDGTLSDTVRWVMEKDPQVPIGYIPAGTTNDFANALKLSQGVEKTVERILNAEPKEFDLGIFGETSFVYTASFGAFAGSSYKTDPALKHAMGHFAYVLEGVKELPQIHPINVSVNTAEEESFDGDVIFGAVTNSTSLGGMVKYREEDVDFSDGKFELMLIKKPRSFAALNRDVMSLASGKYENDGIFFTHTSGASFSFGEDVDWSLDGEMARGGRQAEFKVLKGAYKLCV